MADKVRVFPDGDVWVVKRHNASKASAIRNTKVEALKIARDIALNQNLDIVICGKDGRVQRTVSPKDIPEAEDKGNCFLTTACVTYYGLSDTCYYLKTLRGFRDKYLLKSNEGIGLVNQYYLIAPRIVALINSSPSKETIYVELMNKIKKACAEIENKNFEKATSIYRASVLRLCVYFKII